MLQPGTRLNNTYTVVEAIGSGGGGIVYKAYHERLQTYVVVKQDVYKRQQYGNGVYDSRESIFLDFPYCLGNSGDKSGNALSFRLWIQDPSF